MARLQRKKKTEKKKRPGDVGESAATAIEPVADAAEGDSASAPVREIQKKKPPLPQKNNCLAQTCLLSLLPSIQRWQEGKFLEFS